MSLNRTFDDGLPNQMPRIGKKNMARQRSFL